MLPGSVSQHVCLHYTHLTGSPPLPWRTMLRAATGSCVTCAQTGGPKCLRCDSATGRCLASAGGTYLSAGAELAACIVHRVTLLWLSGCLSGCPGAFSRPCRASNAATFWPCRPPRPHHADLASCLPLPASHCKAGYARMNLWHRCHMTSLSLPNLQSPASACLVWRRAGTSALPATRQLVPAAPAPPATA